MGEVKANFGFDESSFIKKHNENIKSELITTTDDKLKIALIEHQERLLKGKSWQTPLSILITITAMFTTTDFHNFWFIHADFLEALFTIIGFMSAIWLIKELCALITNRGKTSVQYLVELIKNSVEE